MAKILRGLSAYMERDKVSDDRRVDENALSPPGELLDVSQAPCTHIPSIEISDVYMYPELSSVKSDND
jgi:hypothetical protein